MKPILLSLLWLTVGCAYAALPSAEPLESGSPAAAAELFREDVIPNLSIELSPSQFEQLRQRPRRYVLGTVHEGDRVYTNVSIRLKGGPGSFRQIDDRPAFTLNFARQAPGQKFHGLKKLHLNNSVQDRTYLAEKISRELFLAAGVPAPRAGHAWVRFNGRTLGFYVLIEGINKQFLKQHFSDPAGNLYDGHSQHDVNTRMERNSGEDPDTRKRALAAAAAEPDLEQRKTRLEGVLDVDRFLSFLATEVMLAHWDGYAMNRNNFRIFHDRASDRMVFLPQGVDQVFQRQKNPIYPPMPGLVARAVLEVPEFREAYRERMQQLLTNVWRLDLLTNRIAEVGAKVQASLQEVGSKAADSYPNRVAAFSHRVRLRVRFLGQTLLSHDAPAALDDVDLREQ